MSKVTLEFFKNRFADELKIEQQGLLEKDLNSLREYDSMAKINISLLIEELFEFQIQYETLQTLKTLESLYDFCCSQQNS